jgi:hypothetical protein
MYYKKNSLWRSYDMHTSIQFLKPNERNISSDQW